MHNVVHTCTWMAVKRSTVRLDIFDMADCAHGLQCSHHCGSFGNSAPALPRHQCTTR